MATCIGPELSLTQKAVASGLIVQVPGLSERQQIAIAATRLGMAYDDWFDLGLVDRQGAIQVFSNGFKPTEEQINVDLTYLYRYQRAWQLLVETTEASTLSERDRNRLMDNSQKFVNNVLVIEKVALETPVEQWTTEICRKYREAVNLVWCIYIFSLLPSSEVNLADLDPAKGLDGVFEEYAWAINTQSGSKSLSRLRELFYGSMAFQVVSDRYGKEGNRRRSIPSFSGQEEELDFYLAQARKEGMSPRRATVIKFLFPIFYTLINKVNGWNKNSE